MSKYIDAEKLKAFKETLADIIVSSQGLCTYDSCKQRADEETPYLLSTIDSLQQEQPEVEFETEYAKFSNDPNALDYAFPIDLADYKDFARHFYELGKKESK